MSFIASVHLAGTKNYTALYEYERAQGSLTHSSSTLMHSVTAISENTAPSNDHQRRCDAFKMEFGVNSNHFQSKRKGFKM